MGMNDFVNTGWDKVNLIFLLDTSGSMSGERITQLNNAMTVSLEEIQNEAMKREIDLTVRICEFNNGAAWIMGSTKEGEPIDDAAKKWTDLTAKPAGTNTAAAIRLAKECMHTEFLGSNAYNPLVILITDGESNNPADTKQAAVELRNSLKSKKNPNKDKIMRIAVGVVDANQAELEDYASLGNIKDGDTIQENVPLVFNVDNVEKLATLLCNVTKSSIASVTKGGDQGDNPVVDITEEEEEWED